MNPLDFNIVLKREYKKWKNKYYSAKAQSDYKKMERCHAEMQKILTKVERERDEFSKCCDILSQEIDRNRATFKGGRIVEGRA